MQCADKVRRFVFMNPYDCLVLIISWSSWIRSCRGFKLNLKIKGVLFRIIHICSFNSQSNKIHSQISRLWGTHIKRRSWILCVNKRRKRWTILLSKCIWVIRNTLCWHRPRCHWYPCELKIGFCITYLIGVSSGKTRYSNRVWVVLANTIDLESKL